MAVLLNDVSNLRLLIELQRRLDPGVHKPATVAARVSLASQHRLARYFRTPHNAAP